MDRARAPVISPAPAALAGARRQLGRGRARARSIAAGRAWPTCCAASRSAAAAVSPGGSSRRSGSTQSARSRASSTRSCAAPSRRPSPRCRPAVACACWRSAPAPAPRRPPCCPRCRRRARSTSSPTSRRCSWPGPPSNSADAPLPHAPAASTSSASPAAQGFEAGGFDLVVAANVLHATRDLAPTLGSRARAARARRAAGAARGDDAVPLGRHHLRPHRGVVAVRRHRAAPVLSAARSRRAGRRLLADEGFVEPAPCPARRPRGGRCRARRCSSRAARADARPSTGSSSPTRAASAGAWPRSCARAASAACSSRRRHRRPAR